MEDEEWRMKEQIRSADLFLNFPFSIYYNGDESCRYQRPLKKKCGDF
ncbi:hypothetical protein [Eubacterium callanderi]|nr:hypothetical protein [Eubacterium callanderi]MBO1701270.1 hypothetical protein [Eubacterium callanderi]MCB6751738.1 hypothetical protein [Eubacterium callanderi]MCB7103726.1 hypothetical protein [Eubacterium callanderi]